MREREREFECVPGCRNRRGKEGNRAGGNLRSSSGRPNQGKLLYQQRPLELKKKKKKINRLKQYSQQKQRRRRRRKDFGFASAWYMYVHISL